MPQVSVCIPTYNCVKYLPEAVTSVLQQDWTDFELIICDDASTDATPEYCRSLTDERVRYLRFEQNAGQAGNFNRCFDAARGELLTLLSADDCFLPGLLAARVGRFNRDPQLGFVVGAMQMMDAAGAATALARHWTADRRFAKGALLEPLLGGAFINTLGLVLRRECWTEAGPFRTDLTWGHDWEWILRLAEKCPAAYASAPLVAYREHDASGTVEQLSAARNGHQERRILQETLARLVAADNNCATWRRPAFQALSRRHMYFAEQALLNGRRTVARNNLWYAARANGGMLLRPTFWVLLLSSFGTVGWYDYYRDWRGAMLPNR